MTPTNEILTVDLLIIFCIFNIANHDVYNFLLYTFTIIILVLLAVIYFKLIYRQKQLYNAFHEQNVSREPFVPLLGQLPTMAQYSNKNDLLIYFEELTKKTWEPLRNRLRSNYPSCLL